MESQEGLCFPRGLAAPATAKGANRRPEEPDPNLWVPLGDMTNLASQIRFLGHLKQETG